MVQLVKRGADLEKGIEVKLNDLHDGHEKERQKLEADLEVRKQKLNDDYEQRVSVLFLLTHFSSLIALHHSELH